MNPLADIINEFRQEIQKEINMFVKDIEAEIKEYPERYEDSCADDMLIWFAERY